MSKFLFALIAALMLFPVSYAHGLTKTGEECAAPTKEEAAGIVRVLDPRLSILDIQPSPIKALWEVTIAAPGQKVIGYIDCSKRYLIMGSLIDIKEKKDITREKTEELNKVVLSKSQLSEIPLDDAIVMGDKNAPHKVIVFSDPKCPYCAKLHAEIKKVIAEKKDIAFFIKMFPLPMHKGADVEAKAIVCAKSVALLDAAFEGKEIPPATCNTTAIDDNIKLGAKLGINGTPAIIFPDGRVQPGAMDADSLIKVIEKK